MPSTYAVPTPISKLKFVIIGAGISGATAATELVKQGADKNNITILEKNQRVGGKLNTYTTDDAVKIDMGAVLISPTHPAIEPIAQYGLAVESILPHNSKHMDEIIYHDQKSFYQKSFFWAKYMFQAVKFSLLGSSTAPDTPFGQVVENKNLFELSRILKPLIPGMGYGPMEDMSLAQVQTYVDHTLLAGPVLKANPGKVLVRVQAGYQSVPEKMLEDFDVKKSIKITRIDRLCSGSGHVYYRDKHDSDAPLQSIEADYIILTISPLYWPNLGMRLTASEQACVDQLTYYRYPVAACKIKDLTAEQVFVPSALEKSGFGHVALIVPKSEAVDGWRYCAVYINLTSGPNTFNLEEGSEGRDSMLADLAALGYNEVEILHQKTWKEYASTPPLDIVKELERAQGANNTLYIGTYMRFENVSNAMNYAKETILKNFGKPESCLQNAKTYCNRLKLFFNLKRAEPMPIPENELVASSSFLKRN